MTLESVAESFVEFLPVLVIEVGKAGQAPLFESVIGCSPDILPVYVGIAGHKFGDLVCEGLSRKCLCCFGCHLLAPSCCAEMLY